MHFRTWAFAYQLDMPQGRLSTLAMGAKGPIVFQRRLSVSCTSVEDAKAHDKIHLWILKVHSRSLLWLWFVFFYHVLNSFSEEDESSKINFAHCWQLVFLSGLACCEVERMLAGLLNRSQNFQENIWTSSSCLMAICISLFLNFLILK